MGCRSKNLKKLIYYRDIPSVGEVWEKKAKRRETKTQIDANGEGI